MFALTALVHTIAPLLLLNRHGRHNTTDEMRSTASLLFLLTLVKAHGDHSFDLSDEDIGMSYAERHVRLLLYSPLISTLPLALLNSSSLIDNQEEANDRCTQNIT